MTRSPDSRRFGEGPLGGHVAPIAVLTAVLALTAIGATSPAWCAGTIVLAERYPSADRPTRVIVQDDSGTPVAGATIRAVYRPGSSVEYSAELGETGADGRLMWTPELAGIVSLEAVWKTDNAPEESVRINASVKFRSAPVSGVLIMIFAGLLLVGGSAVRMARVLRSTD